jgi:hypothetical protein
MSDPVLPDMVRAEWTWTHAQWRRIVNLALACAPKAPEPGLHGPRHLIYPSLAERKLKRIARIAQYSTKTPDYLP